MSAHARLQRKKSRGAEREHMPVFAVEPIAIQRALPALQPKLTISQPGDPYEQEAERVADQVLRMPDPAIQRSADDDEPEEEPLLVSPANQQPIQRSAANLVQRQADIDAGVAEPQDASLPGGVPFPSDMPEPRSDGEKSIANDELPKDIKISMASDKEEGDLGHAWIMIEMPGGIQDSYGFWPNDMTVLSVLQGVSWNGQIMHPDDAHKPDTLYSSFINRKQLARAIAYAKKQDGTIYHLFFYNCSTFARRMFEVATGEQAPSGGLLIDSPNDLADEMRERNKDKNLDALGRPLPGQPKLSISQLGDIYEQEADRVADQVMRLSFPESAFQSTSPLHIHRSTVQLSAPAVISQIETSSAALRGSGQPLDAATRAFMEPRFGHDFSQVRVHTDGQAAQSAAAVNALAYTVGQDVVFGAGQYQPQSDAGRRLLAHELTHTLQQDGTSSDIYAFREVGDPAQTSTWGNYDTEENRRDPKFHQTIAAAPRAAGELTKVLADRAAPATEEEREAIRHQITTLIRLNAIAMIGSHRNQIAERKRYFETLAQGTSTGSQSADPTQNTSNSAAHDTANAIRAAASAINRLNAEKDRLEDSQNLINGAVRVNAGPETINEEYQTLWREAQLHSSPAILQQFTATREQMRGRAWGSKKAELLELCRVLANFRRQQLQGLDMSINLFYERFPFFADLPSEYVSTGKKHSTLAKIGLTLVSLLTPAYYPEVWQKEQPPDDATLFQEAQNAFDRLLARINEAIVEVGTDDIDPLDLPGAVAVTRNNLPEPLQAELDKLKQDHEVAKFTREMAFALGGAILSGITGGAAGLGWAATAYISGGSAVAVGAISLGMQAEEKLDRQTLSNASTNTNRTMLGVSAPSLLDWVFLGVSAILAAKDMAGIARELTSLRPHFHEEPTPPRGHENNPAQSQGESASGLSADTDTRSAPHAPASAHETDAAGGAPGTTPNDAQNELEKAIAAQLGAGTNWRIVEIEPGRELYSVGPAGKADMKWGGFQEDSLAEYLSGNQLDPTWYSRDALPGYDVALYEWKVIIEQPTPAGMSYVAPQIGISIPTEIPAKFQYYNPKGLGTPARGRLLGWVKSR